MIRSIHPKMMELILYIVLLTWKLKILFLVSSILSIEMQMQMLLVLAIFFQTASFLQNYKILHSLIESTRANISGWPEPINTFSSFQSAKSGCVGIFRFRFAATSRLSPYIIYVLHIMQINHLFCNHRYKISLCIPLHNNTKWSIYGVIGG